LPKVNSLPKAYRGLMLVSAFQGLQLLDNSYQCQGPSPISMWLSSKLVHLIKRD